MDILWRGQEWLTPRQVRERLPEERKVAYTTVMTVLVRLWNKGRVDRERRGRAFTYRARQSREEYAAGRMEALLELAGDRDVALGHFLEGLSEQEREEVRRLVEDQ